MFTTLNRRLASKPDCAAAADDRATLDNHQRLVEHVIR